MVKKRTVVVEGGIAAEIGGKVRMVYRSFHLLRGSAQPSQVTTERYDRGLLFQSGLILGRFREFGV
jgi:hypothetical protein